MVKTKAAAAAPRKRPAPAQAKRGVARSVARPTKSRVAKKTAATASAFKKPLPAAKKPGGSPTPSKLGAKPKAAKTEKPGKAKKVKLVRDSFTMPEPEYQTISVLKKRCLTSGIAAKKIEILRAAVASLSELSDAALLAAVRRLKVIKTGRPAKGSK
jgi:hypothetical protein